MGHAGKIMLGLSWLVWTLFQGWFAAPLQAQPLGMMSQQPMQFSQYKNLGCPGGRFVFGQISDSSKDQYMLDTVTGRLWQVAESGEVGMYLRAVHYRTEAGGYLPIPEKIPVPENKKTGKK